MPLLLDPGLGSPNHHLNLGVFPGMQGEAEDEMGAWMPGGEQAGAPGSVWRACPLCLLTEAALLR